MPYISLCIYHVEYGMSKMDSVQELQEAYSNEVDSEEVAVDLRQH